ncbi:hypothetical protein VitviT2T_022108 [Vitis vinifera]|uniref:Lipid transfer-like protein VAS n=2 Tax=Vitis vinifera TaxID=29760 RepID=D7SVF0_VITVI|eukprot:XP_010660649.1 PREDICTED: lipid transfer-like protein VAS [Vitis vinifera]
MELKFWACCGIAVIVLVTLVPEGWAQDSSCLNELAPCLNYLNGTRDPPDSCCDPLKSVIKSKPECLCSMISTKGTSQARQAGINVTEAQQLPGRCGQHVNPLSCLSSPPNSKDSVPNSGSIFWSPSLIMKVVAAFSMSIHILWGSKNILT